MQRILFVDDESNVLDAIRRTTHSMRAGWKMEFVTSGPLALEALAREPADVVVTDMRMPGMEGPELLREVKRLYPQTVRLILSGYADPTSIMSVAGLAHRYMAKPCESEVLKSAIVRTKALKALLNNKSLERWIGRFDALPSLPTTYQEVVACLQRPNAALSDIGRIIAKDVAMTATMLKFVNSAFFGAPQAIKTIERAVSFLGVDTITGLVLAHGVFKNSDAPVSRDFNLDQLWQHSLATAACARAIAAHERWGTTRIDEAFLAALLHDVGRVVLAMRPTTPAPAAGAAEAHGEVPVLNVDHAEVGAYLLGLWGFSDSIVEAIAFHDAPGKVSEEVGLAAIVHAADYLANQSDAGHSDAEETVLEPGFAESPEVSSRWEGWRAAWSDRVAGAPGAAL